MPAHQGTPLQGDRGAWDTDGYDTLHAKDIHDAAPKRHVPLPGAAGGMLESDGSMWTRVTSWAVTKLAGWVRGSIIRGGAANWEVYNAKDDHKFLQGNGTDVISDVIANDDLPDPYAYKNGIIVAPIVGGITDVYQNVNMLESELGFTDDLDTINSGVTNQMVILQAEAGHTITVKHGTGNIFLNGGADFDLDGDKTLQLFYDGTNWADIGANGGGTASDVDIGVVLKDETLAADAASIGITGIDQTYDWLEIRLIIRSTWDVDFNDPIDCYYNTDYDLMYYIDNATIGSVDSSRGMVNNHWSTYILTIMGYSRNDINKTMNITGEYYDFAMMAFITEVYDAMRWDKVDPITTIEILTTLGSVKAGSRIVVIGHKQRALGGGGAGHVIQAQGSSMTQRNKLNFTGYGVTGTDDAGNDRTTIDIAAPATKIYMNRRLH